MKLSGCYEILNTVNGKRYIGSAVNIATRLKLHRNSLRRGDHHSQALQRAWNKYGEAAFKFLPILTCAKSMLLFYEQQLFNKVKPGYNILSIAGSSLGSKRTPEQCARNGELKRGNKNALGQKRTPEQCENIAAAQRGKKLSDAHKAKISKAGKGRPKSAGWKAATAKTMPARMKKLCNDNIGRKRTPEQRANLSAGLRLAWARRKAAP